MDPTETSLPDHVRFPESPGGPCPACGSGETRAFFEVAGIPIHSCVLLGDADSARAFPTGDLRLVVCAGCGFVFNELFDPACIDYSEDYEETQGYSGTFRAFLAECIQGLAQGRDLAGKNLIEIGCGRGDFLEQLCAATGARGTGIDPSKTAGRVDLDAGAGLRFLREEYGPQHHSIETAGILCRHTLEHIHDVLGLARSVREHLAQQAAGWTFFEVPDTERILAEGAFWDVYYEHCSYFSAGSLARLFDRAGLKVGGLEKVYGGQYLHLIADVQDDAPSLDRSRLEAPQEMVRLALSFGEACARSLAQWHAWLSASEPESVALWGSGSKATGFLTTLGSWGRVRFVVDINPGKHGKFVAGSGHEIVAPERLVASGVKRVLVMNPIYVDEISRDLKDLGVDVEVRALG